MPHIILRPYFLGLKNKFYRNIDGGRNLKRDILLIFVAILTMTCIYAGFSIVFNKTASNPLFHALIPTKIIELLVYSFFLILLLSSIVSAISNIFHATNMDFLLTLPVSPLRLYFTKLVTITVESSLMMVVFGLPAILAYIFVLDVHPSFILTAILVSIPLVAIPVGLSIALASLFMALAVRLWNRGTLLLITFFAAAIYVMTKIFISLSSVEGSKEGKFGLIMAIGLFDNPCPIWMPSRWMADILSSYVGEPLQFGLLKIGLLYTTAFASLAIGYIAYDSFALKIRSTSTFTTSRYSQNARDIVRRLIEGIYGLLPLGEQTRSLIIKDLTCLIRDQGQALKLLLFVGISFAYLLLFKLSSLGVSLSSQEGQEAWIAFLSCMNFLFVGFILTAVMTRLVYPSVSLEGRAFWIILVAPIPLQKIIKAKFCCWLPLTIPFTVFLLLAGNLALHAPIVSFIPTIIIGVYLALGCTGLAIGLGAVFAQFEWESPNQVTTGFGTLVLFLASTTLVILLFIPASIVIALSVSPAIRRTVGIIASQHVPEQLQYVVRTFGAEAIMGITLFIVLMLTTFVGLTARAYGSKSLIHQTTAQ